MGPRKSVFGILALLLIGFASVSWARSAAGEFSGRTSDGSGLVLPGVTIVITGPGVDARVVTDERGQFSVAAPPSAGSAVYVLKATLPGFASREVIVSPRKPVELTLHLPCHLPDLIVDAGAAAVVNDADAAFLLRVDSVVPFAYRKIGNTCGPGFDVTATVTETIKDVAGRGSTRLSFVVFERPRLEVGSEYLGFFEWIPSEQRLYPYHRGYFAAIVGGEFACHHTTWPCGPVGGVIGILGELAAR